ncbi:3-oxoacyl-ACP reductase FabG [Shinella sp.]|uniref:3-oxoacyl-ACP reductase FabG n=1 Tax=Shinella sp. TaxID=1870904 RepID=UPI0039E308F4
MSLLQGRTAIITGAAQGIGLSIAEAFTAAGANVVIADIDGARADTAATHLKGTGAGDSAGAACDVSSADDMNALVELAVSRFGGLDVFVNNAGITRDATMRKMSEEMFDQVISVHLRGAWLGTRAAANVMREQPGGGSIVNISSISGKVGLAGQTNYSAAKAGIVGLTKAAAKEVGFANVRVNAIQPGLIRTAMTEALPNDIYESRVKDIPLGRAGEPSEIAQVALFLASDMSSYMTGAVLEVTGGRHT